LLAKNQNKPTATNLNNNALHKWSSQDSFGNANSYLRS